MTIYLNFCGDWPLTIEIQQRVQINYRGVNQYFRYARWLCFEFLWNPKENK